ncbi:hypothetical protein E2N92_06340 [Methanofollis formosanus]|uniref:Uncharacterized protein n=1 Tax=Methanofollis formosanus TaxID=299308 RepID=A0A8G1A2B0_9EURY|nr:hypothetical protein [Methanofollis formosanus]QYZ79074.1 hypothetical protein E2N92_06340 [Methanofollis formosanus]
MGACKEAYYNTVERDLKRAYRGEEGWKLERSADVDGSAPDFILSRGRPGSLEQIAVNVRIAPLIGSVDVARMRTAAESLLSKKVQAKKMLLVVPRDVEIAAEMEGIDLFYLETYAVRGGEVIWSRSNLWTADGTPVLGSS